MDHSPALHLQSVGRVTRPAITTITGANLAIQLEPFMDDGMYTFERLSGAVEHRSSNGRLLAISINGKHYIERGGDIDGSHLRLV